jgi:hypothetical protein
MVADMSISLRAGRALTTAFRTANRKSQVRLRSWTSSTTMTSYWLNAASVATWGGGRMHVYA